MSGSLNLLEPSGTVQTRNGIALPLPQGNCRSATAQHTNTAHRCYNTALSAEKATPTLHARQCQPVIIGIELSLSKFGAKFLIFCRKSVSCPYEREKDQPDAHRSLQFTALRLPSTCFGQATVHNQQFCSGSLLYFTVHIMSSPVTDSIRGQRADCY
jgi:hypothetical protein